MTLLDATAALIIFAKENNSGEDAMLNQAIKRMEKRLEILRTRHFKLTNLNQEKAFFSAMAQIGGGADRQLGNIAVIVHEKCHCRITFETFLNCAEISGHGQVLELRCPGCNQLIISADKKNHQ